MKKYFILLLLIFSVQLFAEMKTIVSSLGTMYIRDKKTSIKNKYLTVLSSERTYILDGYIDDKYPITMYLTSHLDFTKKRDTISDKYSGKYYYNNVEKFIYLGENVVELGAPISLKEYPTLDDAYDKKNSTGEFDGFLSAAPSFLGTWKSGKKSFPFYLDRRDYVVDIDEYKFNEDNPKFENMSFDYDAEVLQIIGSKKSSSIEKINKELRRRNEFEPLYLDWKEHVKDEPDSVFNGWTFEGRTSLQYIDNNILSVGYFEVNYTGGTRMNHIYSSAVYSLSSGKKLTVDDLILNVDDNKLIALMREQLKEYMIMAEGSDTTPSEFYEDFENIRLGDSYSINDSGVTFLYDKSEISYNTPEPIEVHFTYDELKPFVKKSSPLWYLFE